MAKRLKEKWRHLYSEMRVVFANTGWENEETLEFVRECDYHYDFETTWVEAEVDPRKGKKTGHRVVDFETASRLAEPFEAVIKKYGIPNIGFPHCTRELKLNPMRSYLASVGWEPGSYDVAVGIRADEGARRSKTASVNGIHYPLMDWEPTEKTDINLIWARRNFRLRLKGYQGNCRGCWKKSLRKLLTIRDETPQAFAFTAEMEAHHGMIGPEFSLHASELPDGYRRVFFRGNMSTKDLFALPSLSAEELADDDSQVTDEYEALWRCANDACEVDFEEV